MVDLTAHREQRSDLENVKDASAAVLQTIDRGATAGVQGNRQTSNALCKLIELKLKLSPISCLKPQDSVVANFNYLHRR